MSRVVLAMALAVVCLSIFGCTQDPTPGITAPTGSVDRVPAPKKTFSVQITLPTPTGFSPALVPPVFDVEWVAQKAEDIRWILLPTFGNQWTATLEFIRNNPDSPLWSDWTPYRPMRDVGTSFRSPPMDFGHYTFAVQARSPTGEVTDILLGESVARLAVGPRTTGPLFTVANRYIGSIQTTTITTPPVVVEIPPNVAMGFELSATAEHYGGRVEGFRYGWDILDPEDDLQWDIPFTPFKGKEVINIGPRVFMFGRRTFHAEVIDNSGFRSRVTVQMDIVPATMTRPLLIVDDWKEGPFDFLRSFGAQPSDAEHDAFWLDMVEDVDGFDPAQDVFEVTNGHGPSLETMLGYQNVIWYSSGAPSSALADYVRFRDPSLPPAGPFTANALALYMATGGHIMLCGQQPMHAVVNQNSFAPARAAFPLIYRYELAGDQDGSYNGNGGVGEYSFAYAEGCVNVVDRAFSQNPADVRRPPGQACPVHLLRSGNRRTEGLRACEPTNGGFPRLELRTEVASSGKFFHASVSGLNTDIYNPPYFAAMTACGSVAEYGRSCFEPIYGLECLNTSSPTFDAPVAYWTSAFTHAVPTNGVAARSIVWGFQPVYFNPSEVSAAMDIVLFDEWQLTRKP